ncbi:MAG: metalloregulator ArsR/SmtB family transcription factor [Terracidiphilus sp.]
MSHKLRKRLTAKPKARARVFAALGDRTRLSLVARLCSGKPCSITQLAEDSKLTRQAITKHLRVLERVGIVRSTYAGRERLFEFDPEPLEGLRDFLDSVSKQWDKALSHLKSFVERESPE